MKRIILDTNIVVKNPRLLGIKLPGTVFVISTHVLNQLHALFGSKKELLAIIEQATQEGIVEIAVSLSHEFLGTGSEKRFPDLSIAGRDLIAIAVRNGGGLGEECYISTTDLEIQQTAMDLGIKVFFGQDVWETIDAAKAAPNKTELQEKIEEFEKRGYKRMQNQIIVPIIIAGAIFVLNDYRSIIYNYVNVWGIIAFFVASGIMLFVIRERWRLGYGITEFLFGILSVIWVFWPGFDYHHIASFDHDVKLVGGLYIMVRGQDNIVKALKGTKPGVYLAEKFRLGL